MCILTELTQYTTQHNNQAFYQTSRTTNHKNQLYIQTNNCITFSEHGIITTTTIQFKNLKISSSKHKFNAHNFQTRTQNQRSKIPISPAGDEFAVNKDSTSIATLKSKPAIE